MLKHSSVKNNDWIFIVDSDEVYKKNRFIKT